MKNYISSANKNEIINTLTSKLLEKRRKINDDFINWIINDVPKLFPESIAMALSDPEARECMSMVDVFNLYIHGEYIKIKTPVKVLNPCEWMNYPEVKKMINRYHSDLECVDQEINYFKTQLKCALSRINTPAKMKREFPEAYSIYEKIKDRNEALDVTDEELSSANSLKDIINKALEVKSCTFSE